MRNGTRLSSTDRSSAGLGTGDKTIEKQPVAETVDGYPSSTCDGAGEMGQRATEMEGAQVRWCSGAWPRRKRREAAMAGALGLRLAGPIAYDGVMHAKPWIGDGTAAATGRDIHRAVRGYVGGCGLLWLLAGGAAWVL